MKENARQGFWNGALPPIGYRIVEAAEQRGHRTKKTLEIDPIQAETVRLIFRLAREGNGSSGPMASNRLPSISTNLASARATADAGASTPCTRCSGAACGGAMTLKTGKSGRYRYYTCCTKARQGETGCKGRTVPMEKLNSLVAEHIEQRLLQPKRLEQILSRVLDRREGARQEPHNSHRRIAQASDPKRKPNSSGCTTRSKTKSPMYRTRCSRSA